MYCILITGIPASGKTTMAAFLGDKMNLPVISKDAVKELLYDTIGFRTRSEKVKLGTAAMNIMYHMAEQLMKSSLPFILENNFETVSKPGLCRILNTFSYKAVTVTLTGDYPVLYKRFLERNNNPTRHRGHVVNCYPEEPSPEHTPQISYEDFVNGITSRGMDAFTVHGPHITLDTTDFHQVDKEALAQEIANICKALLVTIHG